MEALEIARDIYKMIKEKAERNNISEIKYVKLVIGKASGVNKKMMVKTLDDCIFPETICEDAKLDIYEEDVKIKCENCNTILTTRDNFLIYCSSCGSHNFKVIGGRDIYIDKIKGTN